MKWSHCHRGEDYYFPITAQCFFPPIPQLAFEYNLLLNKTSQFALIIDTLLCFISSEEVPVSFTI